MIMVVRLLRRDLFAAHDAAVVDRIIEADPHIALRDPEGL